MLLEVKNLNAGYGAIQILREISIRVDEGEAVAIMGPNGAGKTTLMRALVGVLPAMSGTVVFDGRDVTNLAPEQISPLGMALVPQGRELFPEMTVRENLLLGAYAVKDPERKKETLEQVYELFPRLKEREQQQAGTLSGGEQQMCAIGRGLMSNPKLLMIDEMSLGLAPVLVERILASLNVLREQGLTILLVEQDVEAALEFADRAYIMETGQILKEGSTNDLYNDPGVKEAYLGII
jgi:branched-chain amino acid transport system ATP-binding protein